MKAGKLIEELSKLDPNDDIWVSDSEHGPEPVDVLLKEEVTEVVSYTPWQTARRDVYVLYP